MNNHWDDRIKLRTVVSTTDTAGFHTETTSDVEVWAESKSATRQEYYMADSVGKRADSVFVVKNIDYSGQMKVEWNGTEYEVVRTYQRSMDDIELTCARK